MYSVQASKRCHYFHRG